MEQLLRVEEKDGEVRVKVKEEDEDEDEDEDDYTEDSFYESDDDRSDDYDVSDDSDNRVKIEVRVEDGFAEVRLENAESRDEFSTAYTSRAALVSLLAIRSGLSEATISNALDLEVED